MEKLKRLKYSNRAVNHSNKTATVMFRYETVAS